MAAGGRGLSSSSDKAQRTPHGSQADWPCARRRQERCGRRGASHHPAPPRQACPAGGETGALLPRTVPRPSSRAGRVRAHPFLPAPCPARPEGWSGCMPDPAGCRVRDGFYAGCTGALSGTTDTGRGRATGAAPRTGSQQVRVSGSRRPQLAPLRSLGIAAPAAARPLRSGPAVSLPLY